MASFKVNINNFSKNNTIFIRSFFLFLFFRLSPDASPLDFSIWNQLSRSVCDTVPKNREDLVQRLQQRWHDVLKVDYVKKTCSAAWDRLRRVVDANGEYLKPKDVVDENNNV